MSETLRRRPRVTEENAEADDDLVARVRHDPRVFAELYERYVEAVLRYCYRRLGNWPDAEDVTSLVFARVAVALPRYRPGSFRSWLFTIARNAVANSRRGRDPEEPLDRAGELLDEGPTPEQIAFAAEERNELARALRQLPDMQRRVIELRLAGLMGPETARVLDRSHAAVKMLQLRALDRLQDVLRVRRGTMARGDLELAGWLDRHVTDSVVGGWTFMQLDRVSLGASESLVDPVQGDAGFVRTGPAMTLFGSGGQNGAGGTAGKAEAGVGTASVGVEARAQAEPVAGTAGEPAAISGAGGIAVAGGANETANGQVSGWGTGGATGGVAASGGEPQTTDAEPQAGTSAGGGRIDVLEPNAGGEDKGIGEDGAAIAGGGNATPIESVAISRIVPASASGVVESSGTTEIRNTGSGQAIAAILPLVPGFSESKGGAPPAGEAGAGGGNGPLPRPNSPHRHPGGRRPLSLPRERGTLPSDWPGAVENFGDVVW